MCWGTLPYAHEYGFDRMPIALLEAIFQVTKEVSHTKKHLGSLLKIWSDKHDSPTNEEKSRLQALANEIGIENLAHVTVPSTEDYAYRI